MIKRLLRDIVRGFLRWIGIFVVNEQYRIHTLALEDGDAVIVNVQADFDLEDAERLRIAFERALDNKHKALILDNIKLEKLSKMSLKDITLSNNLISEPMERI